MPTADLTVVLANYNHARYLPRALDAILTQSVRPREVLALDDASTDDSLAVLDGYARRDPVVRVIRSATNLGVVANFNKGIELASGEYLLLAAADDYILPGFHEKSVAQLDAHPRAAVCFAFNSLRHGDDGPLIEYPSGWHGEPGFLSPNELEMLRPLVVPGHAAICRREMLREVGGFLPDLKWFSDWFAFLAVAFRHGACHLPETLAVRMIYPTAYSAAIGDREKNLPVLGAFFDRLISPRFADIVPRFRRNGTASFVGTDLLRAAARRPDAWEPRILGLLNGFVPEQYQALLDDPDPAVRSLAEFFLGPFWRAAAERRTEYAKEQHRLRVELERMRREAPPPGTLGKLRWLVKLFTRKLRRLPLRLGSKYGQWPPLS